MRGPDGLDSFLRSSFSVSLETGRCFFFFDFGAAIGVDIKGAMGEVRGVLGAEVVDWLLIPA